jgi:hypothetical protein
MSKKFLTWTLILAFATCHSPAFIRADGSQESTNIQEETLVEPSSPNEQPTSTPTESSEFSEQEATEDEEDPQGAPVNPTDSSEQKKSNRQFWTNLSIACVAVLIAVVSILVVSNNNGKKK